MKHTSLYKEFKQTGVATCKIHGTHDEWSVLNSKKVTKGKLYSWNGLNCKKCGRERAAIHRTQNPDYQDKYRFSWRGTITRAIAYAGRRAKDKNLPFSISSEWVIQQLEKQNNKCAYSGIEFEWHRIKPRYRLISIDQKHPGKGYTPENSIIVCWAINLMKNNIPLEEFQFLCKAVAEKSDR